MKKKVPSHLRKIMLKCGLTHISHNVADPHIKGNCVFQIKDPQVKEMRIAVHLATGNRQATPTGKLSAIISFSTLATHILKLELLLEFKIERDPISTKTVFVFPSGV